MVKYIGFYVYHRSYGVLTMVLRNNRLIDVLSVRGVENVSSLPIYCDICFGRSTASPRLPSPPHSPPKNMGPMYEGVVNTTPTTARRTAYVRRPSRASHASDTLQYASCQLQRRIPSFKSRQKRLQRQRNPNPPPLLAESQSLKKKT